MIYATSYYLNELIAKELRCTIELYRQSKNTIYFDGDYWVAEQEIRDFIFSTPYFNYDLKEFLYNYDDSIFIEVTEDWFYKFLENTYLWSESEEWLYCDVSFIRDPSLNMNDKVELDLMPYNKAVFYCERIF